MSTPSEPTDAQLPEETSKREVPFDKEDLTFAPDDVVENSDADPDADRETDPEVDPEADPGPAVDDDSGTPDQG